MIKVVALGLCVITEVVSFSVIADDRLVWPQSDAFYQGQANQKLHALDQPMGSGGSPSPSFGYVQPQQSYVMPPYAQQGGYGYYPPVMGGGVPYANNGFPNVGSFMPPMPNSFSFPNPANAMTGFGFPSFGR